MSKIGIEHKWFSTKKLSNINKFDALKDDRLVHTYRDACVLLGGNAFPLCIITLYVHIKGTFIRLYFILGLQDQARKSL